jgi:hypothetical protein
MKNLFVILVLLVVIAFSTAPVIADDEYTGATYCSTSYDGSFRYVIDAGGQNVLICQDDQYNDYCAIFGNYYSYSTYFKTTCF